MFDIFTSREIATFTWFCILIIWGFTVKSVREAFADVIKALCKQFFIISFIILLGYELSILSVLFRLPFWDENLTKDWIFWFIFAGVPTCYNSVSNYRDKHYFRKVVIDNVKFAVIIEFLTSTYTFGMIAELIILPILIVVIFCQVYTKHKEDYRSTHIVFSVMEVLFGLAIIINAIIKAISDYASFGTITTWVSFVLPLIMTIVSLPVMYLFAVGSAYSDIGMRLKSNKYLDKTMLRKMKRIILRLCGVRLKKLRIVSTDYPKRIMMIFTEEDMGEFLAMAKEELARM